MNKIKLILICVVTVILIALGITVAIQSKKISNLNESLSNAITNEKALLLKNNDNENEIRSLKLSVEQLDYFNDSITEKLNQARKQLKIKDADLKQLQYLKTLAAKTDTVFIKDTIFVEKTHIDTTIGDQWYKLNLQLEYPNKITASPMFISEKSIITSVKKETIKPPKKCKFARMFQKKHKVVVVDIQENNPYINTESYRHVEIIKP